MIALFTQSCEQDSIDVGAMIDTKDGRKYKTVTLGDIEWLAEDYQYEETMYYNYNQAINSAPPGWELPNMEDWNQLLETYKKNPKELELYGESNLYLSFNERKNLNNFYYYAGNSYWVNQSYLYGERPDSLPLSQSHSVIRRWRFEGDLDDLLGVQLIKYNDTRISRLV